MAYLGGEANNGSLTTVENDVQLSQNTWVFIQTKKVSYLVSCASFSPVVRDELRWALGHEI